MDFQNPNKLNLWWHSFLFHTLMSGMYRKYAATLELKGDEKVLDFGGGMGALTRHIAPLLDNGGKLTCLDLSEAMIGVARKKLKHLDNVEFIVGDVTKVDLPLAGYDVVVIHFMLHEIDKQERQTVVTRLAALLRPGGGLHIREPIKEGHGIPAEEIRSLMSDAGLSETSSRQGKVPTMGTTYEGVFEKPRE